MHAKIYPPYKLYTKANVAKRICTVDEALEVFRNDGKEDQIPQFLENLNKLAMTSNFVKVPGQDTWVHDGTFDIMEYARYYCEKDCEGVCPGETGKGGCTVFLSGELGPGTVSESEASLASGERRESEKSCDATCEVTVSMTEVCSLNMARQASTGKSPCP